MGNERFLKKKIFKSKIRLHSTSPCDLSVGWGGRGKMLLNQWEVGKVSDIDLG